MKLTLSPPKIEGRMLGSLDTIFCSVGIPVFFWCFYEISLAIRREETWSAGAFFLGLLAAFMLYGGLGGIGGMLSRMRLSDEGISYRVWRRHSISWDAITELSFPVYVPRSGFTPKLFIRTRDGKTRMIPVGNDQLIGFFTPLSHYKEESCSIGSAAPKRGAGTD